MLRYNNPSCLIHICLLPAQDDCEWGFRRSAPATDETREARVHPLRKRPRVHCHASSELVEKSWDQY